MNSMSGGRGHRPMSGKSLSRNDKIPSGYRAGQLQQFEPGQMELLDQGYDRVGPDSNTSRLAAGDQGMFDEMEAPALRQFSGLQGNMASRFSAGGDLGSRRSSGFQNEMSAAGSNFAQELQARRQGLMRQATQDLHSMSQDLMGQRPYDKFVAEKSQKGSSGWGGIAGAGVGLGASYLSGGAIDPITGAKLGYKVGSSF